MFSSQTICVEDVGIHFSMKTETKNTYLTRIINYMNELYTADSVAHRIPTPYTIGNMVLLPRTGPRMTKESPKTKAVSNIIK